MSVVDGNFDDPPPHPLHHLVKVEQDNAAAVFQRAKPGGSILDESASVPAVWGTDGDAVAWAEGEPLLIVGPSGVGKTTLAAQLVRASVGLDHEVLRWPVKPAERLLYLGCDRPRQIRRALARIFTEDDRATLDDRLRFWSGPPPADFAKHPTTLVQMCKELECDRVVIDSLEDVCIGLSKDEEGAALNSAMQHAIAAGIDVLGLHHQRKGQGSPPKTLEDVYGSTWITAGAGSVILLWGAAGDPLVDLHHLKQPATDLGPLKIEHDHLGRSRISAGFDLVRFMRLNPDGVTSGQVAAAWFNTTSPTDQQRAKAKRKLDKLHADEKARCEPGSVGGDGGTQGHRYRIEEEPQK